ncbi:glycine zipper 2TM domain-containing protein [Sphingomonas sp. PR090111-T3T-6A]|uniref:glycine zipper 2TM domain-containing protein n=1 Tax=Sphingomonas sp. PR090111-T3T-6A TaxID=685778 RepID=UPI000370460C|nr:glycine zipper 2TM domain-containing protein [Sphingomonas sp. PR090111-T3T-6A]
MKKMMFGVVAATLMAAPMALPAPALAQDRYHWQGDRHDWNPSDSYRSDRRYRERRLGRNDQVYRGRDGRYYCRRNDGTTGLVIGAIGGGVLGNVVGGGTLGTLLGAGGGALLGRSIDRGKVRCR